MRCIALVLTCLDFVGLGRRLQIVDDSPDVQHQVYSKVCSQYAVADLEQLLSEGGISVNNPKKVLATLLLACDPAVAWRGAGAKHHCSLILRSPRHEPVGLGSSTCARCGDVLLVAVDDASAQGTVTWSPKTFARMEKQMEALYNYPQAETHQLLQTLASEARSKDAVAVHMLGEIAELSEKLEEHQRNKDQWYTVVDENYEGRIYEQMRELRRRIQEFVQMVQDIKELRSPLSSDPLEVIEILRRANSAEDNASEVTLAWDAESLARMQVDLEFSSGNSPDAETQVLFQVLVDQARKDNVLAKHMLVESADLTEKLEKVKIEKERWWSGVVDERQEKPRYAELRLLRGRIQRFVEMVETIGDLRSQQISNASKAVEQSAVLKARRELARLTFREGDDTIRRDTDYYLQFFKTTFRWSPILLQEVTKTAAYDALIKPVLDTAEERAKATGVQQGDLDKVRTAIERVGEVVARKLIFLYPEELSEILGAIVRLGEVAFEGLAAKPQGSDQEASRGTEFDEISSALGTLRDVAFQRLSLRQEEFDELRAAVDDLSAVLRTSANREVAGQLTEVSRELRRADEDETSR